MSRFGCFVLLLVPAAASAQAIQKASSATAPLQPGDVVRYTITLRDEGPGGWTDVRVTDSLPQGLDWVAASATVVAPVTIPASYADSFAARRWDGSSGSLPWAATPWIEGGDDGCATSGGVSVVGFPGLYAAELRGPGRSLARAADLSGAIRATLSFRMLRSSFDNAKDWVALLVSRGGVETELARWAGHVDDRAPVRQSFDVGPYATAGFRMRFVTSPSFHEKNDAFLLDDVRIDLERRELRTSSGNAPPAVAVLADLRAGESATIAFDARVTPALPPDATSVTNVASFTTRETTEPRSASVTDPLLDADGDGIAVHADCDDHNPTCGRSCADLDLDSVCDSSDAQLTEASAVALPGNPDGLALGDVDGDGIREAAVVVRGSRYEGDTFVPGTGTLLLFRADGTLRWQAQTGHELAGFPLVADLDGDGRDEVVACDLDPAGACHVYGGDGSERWTTGAFSYPAMTLGGPSAAPIDGGPGDDLVVVAFGGELALVDGATGAERWRWDASASGELFFGHAAIDDVDGDGAPEVVACGATWGTLVVLDARTGTVEATGRLPAAADGSQSYCWGSGPALADLDPAPGLEIVVALDGWGDTPPRLCAFTARVERLWCADQPASLEFTGPAIADADGDGRYEVYLLLSTGVLRAYDDRGQLLAEASLGVETWGSPVPIDLHADGRLEIVAEDAAGFVLLDAATLEPTARHDGPRLSFYPSPIHAPHGDHTDVLVTTWDSSELLFFALDTPDPGPWTALGGGNAHRGRYERAVRP